MSKHRLELFTDAVLAIILTIMVLDLKTPNVSGRQGLRELSFDLLLYAIGFLMVAVAWLVHHQYFLKIREINGAMIRANLLILFFVSLLPLSVRAVAAHPNEPVYAALACGNVELMVMSFTAMRFAVRGLHRNDPGFEHWFRIRNRVGASASVAVVAAGALAYVSMYLTAVIMLAWFGLYFFLI